MKWLKRLATTVAALLLAASSLDAYQYFGTDELYLDYLGRFIRPGGSLGVVAVGLTQPLLKFPQYGEAGVGKLPGFLAENPPKVIRQVIKGIRKQKLYVYPSLFSRTVWYGT